jgi:hypothetical protein
MIDTMPGGDPIILEKVPIMTYCGCCMKPMKCIHGNMFTCQICGRNYEKEEGEFI